MMILFIMMIYYDINDSINDNINNKTNVINDDNHCTTKKDDNDGNNMILLMMIIMIMMTIITASWHRNAALLTLYDESLSFSGGFPSQRAYPWCYVVVFGNPNKLLNKQSCYWWFMTPWCPCNVMSIRLINILWIVRSVAVIRISVSIKPDRFINKLTTTDSIIDDGD